MATVVFIGISVVVGAQHTQAWTKNAFLLHSRTAQVVAFFIPTAKPPLKAAQEVAFFIPIPKHGPQREAVGALTLQARAGRDVAFFIPIPKHGPQCEASGASLQAVG
ncbi:MAG TPA: hypothetical protein VGD78_19140 [Chthoniobacterales bacterium]